MRFGQAIFGERDRGHELLAASPGFPDARSLRGRMDLQGSPPPHGTWDPYLSGFAWGDSYVLARTAPDPTAGRSGMVFSRAFALPAEAVAARSDLLGLMELLDELGDGREGVEDLGWKPGSRSPTPNAGLTRALLAGGGGPLIWPGQTGFADAIAALWANLWPAARLGLSFRIGFSPQDVASSIPTIVTTPTALLTRWSGFTVVRPNCAAEAASRAEALLMGDGRADGLRHLVARMAAGTPAIADLSQFEDLEALLRDGGGVSDLVDGLRLICHLCPEPEVADEEKRLLLDRAVLAMPEATATEVRMMRNLDLAAIRAPDPFWRACETWAGTALWREADAGLVEATLADAFSPAPVAAWRSSIASGARSALIGRPDAVATDVWRASLGRPELLAMLLEGRPPGGAVERALAEAAPIGLGDAGPRFADFALRSGLGLLHAGCCAGFLTPVEAVRRHLAAFPSDAAAVSLASRHASGRDLVSIAVASADPETLANAAEACARDLSLLGDLDVSNGRWRALWAAALLRDAAAWQGVRNPQASVVALFELVLDMSVDAGDLLAALGTTPLANLLAQPRRGEIWEKLPRGSRDAYLFATADAWIAAVESGSDVRETEAELACTITAPERFQPSLIRLLDSPGRGVAMFRALPGLSAAEFQKWITQVVDSGRRFDTASAELVGGLIASRGWTDAARAAADAVIDRGRDDLRPAIAYVVDMIGMLRRFRLDMLGQDPPASAKWRILEEVGVLHYGWGPGDEGLWERAGGKLGDIPKAETGAEAWRIVVSRAEKGKGDIDVNRLIATMAEDWPDSPTIRKMRFDPLFAKHR